MLLTPHEVIDLAIMALAVGFIFSGMIPRKEELYYGIRVKSLDLSHLLYSAAIAAPAIILHELGHKFVAIALGLSATFHAAYEWLAIGVFLKLINFGLLFFVPAYVEISGAQTPLMSSLTAFAGPAVNLLLFIGSWYALKDRKLAKKYGIPLHFTKEINKFLFIFNMLPIPFFDGFTVYSGLFHALRG